MNRLIARLLEQPVVYATWQRPFVEQKLAPLIRSGVFEQSEKVLDVGCGPGTNAGRFEHADYTGVDLNPMYIEAAQSRFKGRFIVGDAARLEFNEKFDCILANSLYHHLDDDAIDRSLKSLHEMLTPDGSIHIVDLVLPERPGVPRAVARMDRGDYPRPLHEWHATFSRHFELACFEPFSLRLAGVAIWDLVYVQGRRKA